MATGKLKRTVLEAPASKVRSTNVALPQRSTSSAVEDRVP
jgi:hypothetical protein